MNSRPTRLGPIALLLLVAFACLVILAIAARAQAVVETPRVYLDTTMPVQGGRIIEVDAGGDLQGNLNAARSGDTIVIQSGATFMGNFTLPNKSGSGWIVIQSSASASLSPGLRVSLAQGSQMPKIVSPNADGAITAAPGAHHWRLVGLEIAVASNVSLNYGIVRLGNGDEKTLAELPTDITIDRCHIHGNATGDVSRGVALNSSRTAIIDSYISEIHFRGADSQAICGWNGPGPFKIVNNYLEAAGENVMFGGSDASVQNLVPSDIEIRLNHFHKPTQWKESSIWSVKNLFELKNARRVLVDGNVFENNWMNAQTGFAIVFTVRNQDGGNGWATIEDVTFTNNVVKHSAAGINILGRDDIHKSQQANRITIYNNLFQDIGGIEWGGNGRLLQITDTPNVTFSHNTSEQTGNIITAYGSSSPSFTFADNIVSRGSYGVIGDNHGEGTDTIKAYFPSAAFTGNAIVGGVCSRYPIGNTCPSLAAIGATSGAGVDGSLLEAAQMATTAACDLRFSASLGGCNNVYAAVFTTRTGEVNLTFFYTALLGGNGNHIIQLPAGARSYSLEGVGPGAHYDVTAVMTFPDGSICNASLHDNHNRPLSECGGAFGVATIVSAANFRAFATADSIAALFADGLTTTTVSNSGSLPLPTSLAGVQVFFDGQACEMFFASPTQANFHIPANVAVGLHSVRATNSDGKTFNGELYISAQAPAVFTRDMTGGGPAAADYGNGYVSLWVTGIDVRGLALSDVWIQTANGRYQASFVEGMDGRATRFVGVRQVNVIGVPVNGQGAVLNVGSYQSQGFILAR